MQLVNYFKILQINKKKKKKHTLIHMIHHAISQIQRKCVCFCLMDIGWRQILKAYTLQGRRKEELGNQSANCPSWRGSGSSWAPVNMFSQTFHIISSRAFLWNSNCLNSNYSFESYFSLVVIEPFSDWSCIKYMIWLCVCVCVVPS